MQVWMKQGSGWREMASAMTDMKSSTTEHEGK
jgi:hypothetical protein